MRTGVAAATEAATEAAAKGAATAETTAETAKAATEAATKAAAGPRRRAQRGGGLNTGRATRERAMPECSRSSGERGCGSIIAELGAGKGVQ